MQKRKKQIRIIKRIKIWVIMRCNNFSRDEINDKKDRIVKRIEFALLFELFFYRFIFSIINLPSPRLRVFAPPP